MLPVTLDGGFATPTCLSLLPPHIVSAWGRPSMCPSSCATLVIGRSSPAIAADRTLYSSSPSLTRFSSTCTPASPLSDL